jgi:hypothetical protein
MISIPLLQVSDGDLRDHDFVLSAIPVQMEVMGVVRWETPETASPSVRILLFRLADLDEPVQTVVLQRPNSVFYLHNLPIDNTVCVPYTLMTLPP